MWQQHWSSYPYKLRLPFIESLLKRRINFQVPYTSLRLVKPLTKVYKMKVKSFSLLAQSWLLTNPYDLNCISTHVVCGVATRPIPSDRGADELCEDPTVRPRPKAWTRDRVLAYINKALLITFSWRLPISSMLKEDYEW